MAIVKSKLLKQFSENWPNIPKKDLERFMNIILKEIKSSLKRGEKSFLSHPKFISESYWNSLEWLRDLRELQNEKSGIKSRELIREWHENNRHGG